MPWPLVYSQEFLNALHQDKALESYFCGQMDLVVAVFRKYSHHNPVATPWTEGQGLSTQALLVDQMLDYKETSKCCRDYGLVPYLVNEQQLYR